MSTDTLTDLKTGATADANTDAGSAAKDDPEGWGIASWSVVLLALGVVAAYTFNVFEDRHSGAESAACHALANTWPMYAAAYAGLLTTVAAVTLAGRRLLRPLRPRGPVQMAGFVLPAGLLLLGLQALIVWSLYQPASGGTAGCAG
ncbi:hypothetical protein [Streptomyces sp900129855]|uniref:Integral membrane protein n=1 Tax=Streptomyces sp. 900129855 TaxID=3155129 RepID=A0ABV2ZC52_9ACTN